MRIDAHTEFDWFVRLMPIALAVGFIAHTLTRPAPRPAPSSAIVFGCYAAAHAPPILLDATGLRVRQPGYPVIPFHLSRSKTGIVLAAKAPIRVDKVRDRYKFGMDKRGTGRSWGFYRVENGRAYGIFDEAKLRRFRIYTRDGGVLSYEPVDPARCG